MSVVIDDLPLPIVDAAEMLRFATVADADIELTPEGRALVGADILTSKELFAAAARERAPLVRAIVRALETTRDRTLGERFFLDLLERGFSEDDARAHVPRLEVRAGPEPAATGQRRKRSPRPLPKIRRRGVLGGLINEYERAA